MPSVLPEVRISEYQRITALVNQNTNNMTSIVELAFHMHDDLQATRAEVKRLHDKLEEKSRYCKELESEVHELQAIIDEMEKPNATR